MLSRYINFAQDDRGNKLKNATVLVQKWNGAAASIYADRDGLIPIVGATMQTSPNGLFQFYAASGYYKVTVTKTGYQTIVLDDVLLPPVEEKWTPEYFGITEGDTYVDITTGIQAWHNEVIQHISGVVASGRVREGLVRPPPGRYTIDSLLWHPAVSFQMHSRSGSILRYRTNGSPIGPDATRAAFYVLARCVDTTATGAWAPLFENFRLTGNKDAQSEQFTVGIYMEPAGNDPAYPGDTTGYTAMHGRNIEVDNFSGHGISARGGRQRLTLYGRWRSTNHGLMNGTDVIHRGNCLEILGNDPVLTDGGAGGGTGHSIFMNGGSGLVCHGNNIFAPKADARDEAAMALALRNVNGAAITNNVLNDTLTIEYTPEDNGKGRGIVVKGNDFRPNVPVFVSDGVPKGTAAADHNCFIRVSRAKNVSIGVNAYSATLQGHRYENLAAFVDGAKASIDFAASTEEAPDLVKPWHTTNPVPLLISPDSKVSWRWVNPDRDLQRISGAMAVGVAANTEVDDAYALTVGTKPSLFRQDVELMRGYSLVWSESVASAGAAEGGTGAAWAHTRTELPLTHASPLDAFTQPLPTTPVDGKDYVLWTRSGIAQLTVTPAAGHSILGPSTFFLGPGQFIALRFKEDDQSWWIKSSSELPTMFSAGNGSTTLHRYHHRRNVAVANTAVANIFLPGNAFPGWTCGVMKRASSTANVVVQTQASFPSSSIDNPNTGGTYLIQTGAAIEVVCVENADGNSAKFMVRSRASVKFSPMDHGAVGNGVADDSAAVLSAIAAAAALAALFTTDIAGTSVVVDLEGRCYGISAQTDLAASGVVIENGAFVVLGTLTASQYALTISGDYSGVRSVAIDCGKRCRGVLLSGYASFVGANSYVYRYQTYGVTLGETDAYIDGALIFQWHTTDPEFLVEANYTGTNILVDHPDVRISNTISKWAGKTLGSTANAGVTQVTHSHFYNGGSGLILRNRPILVEWVTGAGAIIFQNVYFDNGELRLYEPFVTFVGCSALYNDARCTINFFIGLYANGQTAPYQFHSSDWHHMSEKLKDGTKRFISMESNGANSWAGNWDYWQNSIAGRKSMRELEFVADANKTGDPNVVYFGSGTLSDGQGAKIGVADANTSVALTDIPGLRSAGDMAILHRVRERTLEITADYTVGEADVGRPITHNSATDHTLTLPQDAPAGFHIPVVYNHSTGTLTIVASGGGNIRQPAGSLASVVLGQYETVSIRCTRNAGNAANWSVESRERVVDRAAFHATFTNTASNVTGDGAVTKVTFNTEVFDSGADYDAGVGQFTAPIAGLYAFSAGLDMADVDAGTNGQLLLRVNGVTKCATYMTYFEVVGAGHLAGALSATVKLAAGDEVHISVKANGMPGNTTSLANDPEHNFFSGHVVRYEA